jgi:hypothetical protein
VGVGVGVGVVTAVLVLDDDVNEVLGCPKLASLVA